MDEAAVLSKAAYDFFREGFQTTQSELSQYGLEGYQLDEDLSDDYSVVITRPDGSAVISYRGTDALEDVIPDVAVLFGRHSPFLTKHRLLVTDRFERAFQKYERASTKHPIAYLSGHSLGATQAITTARKYGLTSTTFNPGSSPLVEMLHAGVCSISDCGEKTQTIYTTGMDPISFSSYLFDRATDNVITIPPKHNGDWLSHSLSHFLPPRRRLASAEPTYLQLVDAVTGERRPFCEVFPDECGRA